MPTQPQQVIRALPHVNITGIRMTPVVLADQLIKQYDEVPAESKAVEDCYIAAIAQRQGITPEQLREQLPSDWRLEPGVHLIAGQRASGKSRLAKHLSALLNDSAVLANKVCKITWGERFYSTFPFSDDAWGEFMDALRFGNWSDVGKTITVAYPAKDADGGRQSVAAHRSTIGSQRTRSGNRQAFFDGTVETYEKDPGVLIVDSMTMLPYQQSVAKSSALPGALPSGLYAVLAQLQAVLATRRRYGFLIWNPLGYENISADKLEGVVSSVFIADNTHQDTTTKETRNARWLGAFLTQELNADQTARMIVEERYSWGHSYDVSDSTPVGVTDNGEFSPL